MERRCSMNFKRNVMKPEFSHIYVEKSVLNHERTKNVLNHFSNSEVIVIKDYRDVFNRKKQAHSIQKDSQNLILANKKKDYLYEASPVCQSFDNTYFYYSTSMMNCVYDCEYCFLKGMYPSGNLVVFVNIEDFFQSVEDILTKHPVYLCVSYDTDMLALEPIFHYGKLWSEFTKKHNDLTIEIRTKGTFSKDWKQILVLDRVILAFTLSPLYVTKEYEHGTPSLSRRIEMIDEAMSLGYPVRICFDPMIIFRGYEQAYRQMIKELNEKIDLTKVKDISVGSFRISKNYLSDMRKQYPNSSVLQFPYVCDHGFYHLPNDLLEKVESIIMEELLNIVPKEKIYRWENTHE